MVVSDVSRLSNRDLHAATVDVQPADQLRTHAATVTVNVSCMASRTYSD